MEDDRRRQPRAGVTAHAPEKRERKPEEPSETSGDQGAEHSHWRAVLKRLGLDTLQLPSDGTLAGQWKEFLEQFEAKEFRTQKARKERQ